MEQEWPPRLDSSSCVDAELREELFRRYNAHTALVEALTTIRNIRVRGALTAQQVDRAWEDVETALRAAQEDTP